MTSLHSLLTDLLLVWESVGSEGISAGCKIRCVIYQSKLERDSQSFCQLRGIIIFTVFKKVRPSAASQLLQLFQGDVKVGLMDFVWLLGS